MVAMNRAGPEALNQVRPIQAAANGANTTVELRNTF